MKDLKYSYENLKKFCDENSVELCKDYSNDLVNQKTKIAGKCTNQNCNNLFTKGFEAFLKNSFCNNCVKIEKYKKVKETFLNKYGVIHPSQLQDIKDKIKETNLNKYGVDNPNKNIEIRNKTKATCLKKFGCESPSNNTDVKEKIKKTCLEKYGVEHPSQNELIKQKKIETYMEKYGVINPTQDPVIAEKASNNSYQTKTFTFPSGNTIKYQGYENFAFIDLLKSVNEYDIVNSKKDVPTIWFTSVDGVKRRHYVDIFIPTQNLCIEVKSEWYFNRGKDIIMLKQNAAKELGYNYEIWVYNSKGEKVNCYN